MVKEPSEEDLRQINDAVRQEFGLDLVGIDVIVDIETGRYGIIDVNAFPGL